MDAPIVRWDFIIVNCENFRRKKIKNLRKKIEILKQKKIEMERKVKEENLKKNSRKSAECEIWSKRTKNTWIWRELNCWIRSTLICTSWISIIHYYEHAGWNRIFRCCLSFACFFFFFVSLLRWTLRATEENVIENWVSKCIQIIFTKCVIPLSVFCSREKKSYVVREFPNFELFIELSNFFT